MNYYILLVFLLLIILVINFDKLKGYLILPPLNDNDKKMFGYNIQYILCNTFGVKPFTEEEYLNKKK
jgi:hypothetical protein